MAYDKEKARSEYAQKLRDPRWQKLRLEIMQRDSFACDYCRSTETTLNVHHRYYEKGKAPWEYPPESLVTLCEICHEEESAGRYQAEQDLLLSLRKRGYTHFQVKVLADLLSEDTPFEPHEAVTLVEILCVHEEIAGPTMKCVQELWDDFFKPGALNAQALRRAVLRHFSQ